jgi:hypothetical protein
MGEGKNVRGPSTSRNKKSKSLHTSLLSNIKFAGSLEQFGEWSLKLKVKKKAGGVGKL